MHKFSLFLLLFFLLNMSLQAANSLSYSGRLVQSSGAPVTGPVNLRAELVYTNNTSTILCSQDLTSVALSKGVFHLKLDLNCGAKTLSQVLAETPNGESVAIRIIDQTNSKSYPLQAIHSVPFSKVAEQLPQMGASAGQALAWDGSKWAPTSVGTGNGTVMSVNTGTGLTGGPISTTGTISVAVGGITSTELAANSVTAAKINAGEITSAHISATANIPYSKLQIADGEIPAIKINGLQTQIDNIISSVITNGDTSHTPSNDAVYDALFLKFDKAGGALTTGGTITGLPALPLAGSEATSKDYVDNKVGALATTNIAEGTNYYFTESRVLSTPLTGVNLSEVGTIAANDTVLQAFGKTQKQISDINTTITGNQWTVNGTDVYRANGKVGIGLTTPSWPLHVKSSSTATTALIESTNTAATLAFVDSATIVKPQIGSAGNDLFLQSNGMERLRILGTNGNVGIGTATPSEKLEVVGNIKVSQLCIGTDCRSIWPSVASGSVTTSEIADGTIQTADLGNNQVTYAKLNLTDGDIPLAKLNGALDNTKYLRGDKTWSTFAIDAINSTLSSFTLDAGTKPAITNADTITGAFGKVQKSLNDINADYVSKTGSNAVTGSFNLTGITSFLQIPTPTGAVVNEAANVQYVKNYVDGFGKWAKDGSNIYYSSGNVGIGTTAPTTKLQIVDGTNNYIFSSTSASPLALLKSDLTGPYAYTIGKAQSTNNAANFRYNHLADGSNTNYLGLGFWSNDDLLVLKASGNVGIGTIAPSAKLNVVQSEIGKIAFFDSKAAVNSFNGREVEVQGKGSGTAFHAETQGSGVAATIWSNNATNTNPALSVLQSGTGPAALFSGGNVGIGTNTPTEPLHILKNDGVANGEHWLFRAEKSAAEGGVVIGYEADGTNFVAAKIRSSSSADLVLGTTTFANMFKLKNNGTANFRGNNIPRFNPAMGMQLGDQDWTDFISQQSGTFAYSSVDKGIKTTGDTWFIINSRVPIDPNGVYRVTARIKKIDGTGSVYVGADSLDANFNSINTDSENSYNYFAAQQITVPPGTTYVASGTISGHNIVGGTGDDRFDPDAKYFNVVIITNYTGTGNSVIEAVEIHKIPTLEPWRTPTFENAWTNYGNSYGTAAYFKDNSGMVHIRGLIMGGTFNTCAFTLPVGYRPAFRMLLATQTHNNVIGRVDIQSNGCVTPVIGDASWFSLDGISFRTD